MKEKNYSMNIANAVCDFLNEDDWHFSFDERRGIFKFRLRLKGKLKKVNYIVDIKDDEYLVYAISPLGADEDDGEVRFKVHVLCEGVTPTAEMVKRSIYCPAMMFDRYGSGIVDIIFNGTSGKTAVEKCEKHSESDICSLLAELLSDDEAGASENSDMETMVSHLASRFGITEEDDADSATDDADTIEVYTDLFDKKDQLRKVDREKQKFTKN